MRSRRSGASGAQARSSGACCAATRLLTSWAYLDGVPRYAAVNESVELVRAARLERAVPFANAVLRRLADGARGSLRVPPRGHRGRGRASPLVSRLDCRDVVARARPERRPGTDGVRRTNEPETAVRLVRGEVEGREDPDIPGAWVVDRVEGGRGRRGSRMAAEPCLAARRPCGRGAPRRADARSLRRARGRRRCSPARWWRWRWTRRGPIGLEKNREPVGCDRRSRRPRRRPRPPPDLDGSTARSSTRRARGSGCSPRVPISAGARSRCTSSSSSSSAPPSPACAPAARSCTPRAPSTRSENEAVVDAVLADGAAALDPSLGDEWPLFRHRTRPELVQTLPHVHGTSGFFVARLAVP